MTRLSTALAVLILVGAGCAPAKPPVSGPAPSQEEGSRVPGGSGSTEGGTHVGSWLLTEFTPPGGTVRNVSAEGMTLDLDANGRLSAVFCNSMSGEYSIEGRRITAPTLTSTLKFCTGVPGDVEAHFGSAIATGLTVLGNGAWLELSSDTNAKFSFVRSSEGGTADAPKEERRTVRGTVTKIDLEKMMVDGPAEISIKTSAGSAQMILVPSFGMSLCAARASIADVSTLKVGQEVEARGSAGVDGAIIPCQDADDFLRVVR